MFSSAKKLQEVLKLVVESIVLVISRLGTRTLSSQKLPSLNCSIMIVFDAKA
jgi:hypothetical protein